MPHALGRRGQPPAASCCERRAPEHLPPEEEEVVIVHAEHAIRDFDIWKAAFDRDPLHRKDSGVRRYRISRAIDDPHFLRRNSDEQACSRGRGRRPGWVSGWSVIASW
jgi:hypothetical protein